MTKPAAYSSRAAARRSAISSLTRERHGLTNRRRRCWARATRRFTMQRVGRLTFGREMLVPPSRFLVM
jgi:hypothetical protein